MPTPVVLTNLLPEEVSSELGLSQSFRGKQIFKWLKENTNKMVYYIDGQISTDVREEIRKRI